MNNILNRRDFVKTTAMGTIGLGLASEKLMFSKANQPAGKIGII